MAARKGSPGFSLAMVLVCASLALATAFTLVALTTQHLRVVRERSATEDALLMANEALAQTLSKLRANPNWGQMHTEELVVGPTPDRSARVSFDRSGAQYSTNNLNGRDGTGWNGPVAPGQAELVAVGNSHGVYRTLDAVVSIPIFPYVLAVDGSMQVNGQLRALGPPTTDPSQVNGDPQFPASIGSNTSCTVYGACLVTGDVVCPGTIQLPADAVVDGLIRKHSIQLPAINPSQWDPRGETTAQLLSTVPPGPLHLDDQHYYTNGDVTVSSLLLDGTLLYVNGDLTVTGGITGRGTIVVAGNTHVVGAVSLAGADMVALLGEGDVTIDSNTTDARFFQGLVYTQGNFTASNVTIVGSFISAQANNGTVSNHTMTLQNVTAEYLPAATQLTTATGLFGGDLVGNVYLPSVSNASFSTGSFSSSQLVPEQLPSGLLALAQQQQSATQFPAGMVLVSTLGQTPYFPTQGPPHVQAPASPAGLQLMQQLATQMSGDPYFASMVNRNPTTQAIQGVTLDEAILPGATPMVLQAEATGYDPTSNRFFSISPPTVFALSFDTTTGAVQYLPPQAFFAAAQAQGLNGPAMLQSMLQTQAAVVQIANQMLIANQHQEPVVNLSLNQFMENGVPLKVLSWLER